MKDRRMKALGLFAALSLVVCLIASGIVSDANSSYAATSSLKWTQISIPDEDDMQLYPGYDIGPMAVSPDGSTVFAAVQNELVLTDWVLMKSTNGGFGWQETGLADAMATIADTSDIVAVELSPNWNTDGRIFAATENRVYISENRGSSFTALTAVPGTVYDAGGIAEVTSLALGREDGKVVVAVGTSDGALGGDVYLLEMAIWNAQTIGAYDVLAVGLSPNYASDSTIVAVVTDGTSTIVRSKVADVWDAAIRDAAIKDQNGLDFASYKASLGFDAGYLATDGEPGNNLVVYIGLSAAGPLGDVFRLFWTGWPATAAITDCNVRGDAGPSNPSETNVWSIAVSGTSGATYIVVGTEEIDPTLPPTSNIPGQLLVYTGTPTEGGGSSWDWYPTFLAAGYQAGYKEPTGEAKAYVAMTDLMAYVGTSGAESAVSAALRVSDWSAFSEWNQRGLIDTMIDEVTDMVISEGYYSDGTMLITTYDGTSDASLWRTQSEGRIWERIFCSTLTSPGTCIFDIVRQEGDAVVLAQSGNTGIVPSITNGQYFQETRDAMQPIAALFVADENTYYAGHANGIVWRSTSEGVTWPAEGQSTGDIPTADTVVDLVLTDSGVIFAGTNNGGVYKAGSDLAFERVGPDTPGSTGDIVHVTPDIFDGSYVYAGIQGGAATQGIWRFDQSDDEAEWEQIAGAATVTNVGDISGLVCDSEFGILYAISASTGTGWRCVNPTTMKNDPEFEEVFDGLGAGGSVLRGLKIVLNPTILFAIGGPAYTQLWTTSDEMARMKLLAPEDGSVSGIILEDEAFLGRAMVRLEWKDVESATRYEAQMAFDEDFVSPVDNSYYDGGTGESESLLKMVYPWLGTKYYWRVRVIEPFMSQWSEVWSFVTPLGPALSMPVLLSPEPGSEDVSLMPLLQWNSSVAATGYELILTKNCDWSNPALNLSGDDAISDTAYQLTFALEEHTNYCWKVRGVNDITNSPWSDSLSFTTGSTVVTEDEGLPIWVWVIIALISILMLAIIVLIVHSRSG